MHRQRRNCIASLAGVAILTAAGLTGPVDDAHAAPVQAVMMPRLVTVEGDQVIVVDGSGQAIVYASDGEQAWSPDTTTDRMDWPADGEVTSEFGWRGGRMHNGIDIAAPIGTEITAAAGGRVSFAGWKGGYGKTVEIDHGDGIMTRYAHQATMKVSEDDLVARGERVGKVGMTGSSTGPHLHFEVHADGDEHNPRKRLAEPA
jgi:murein DD-endopeptidase MepM/ murein hydrolase activator NlpD